MHAENSRKLNTEKVSKVFVGDFFRDVAREFGQPGELRCSAHLERLVEIGIDLFESNEEGVPATRLNFQGAGLRLERLASTRVRDDEDAKVILDLVPALGPARPRHEKVPLPRARRHRREPPDELDDLRGYDRDPAFAG